MVGMSELTISSLTSEGHPIRRPLRRLYRQVRGTLGRLSNKLVLLYTLLQEGVTLLDLGEFVEGLRLTHGGAWAVWVSRQQVLKLGQRFLSIALRVHGFDSIQRCLLASIGNPIVEIRRS